MQELRSRLKELLLELCLYYEKNIDDQAGVSREDLRARLEIELDRKVDDILALCKDSSAATSTNNVGNSTADKPQDPQTKVGTQQNQSDGSRSGNNYLRNEKQ